MNIAYFLLPKSRIAYLYDDFTFRQGLEKMRNRGYTAIPVITRDGRYVGTVSEGDFLWRLLDTDDPSMKKAEVGARRIQARCDTRNPYSAKVMEKCGLKYEGTAIQAEWNNSGAGDVACYGLVVGPVVVEEPEETLEPEIEEEEPKVIKTGRKNEISDETIEYVGILAKLELNEEEKEHAKKDMEEMLNYIDKLNELDTTGVEPMSHVFPVNNVFREDVVTNGDGSKETLSNAPAQKDGGFKVPKTIGD